MTGNWGESRGTKASQGWAAVWRGVNFCGGGTMVCGPEEVVPRVADFRGRRGVSSNRVSRERRKP